MDFLLLGIRFALAGLLYMFLYQVLLAMRRDFEAGIEPGTEARLVVKRGPGLPLGREFGLIDNETTLLIGRAAGNDIVLRDPFVSARHARLQRRNGGTWIIDLKSTNGTYVNGKRIRGPKRLRKGDRVEIGETILEFEG